MARRTRRNLPLRLALAGLILALLVHIFVIPLVRAQLGLATKPSGLAGFAPDWAEQYRARAVEALTALWFFSLGATIGSFLNVVAYRLPQRLTLVWQPSRCPWCLVPIKFRDNIPVFGWLILRGRCRCCHLPISPRYPIVELIVAVIFVSLYRIELISGGANLPVRPPNRFHGVIWTIYSLEWDLIRLYAYHTFLLSVLMTCALIRVDKNRMPSRLFIFALLVGLLGPSVWPDLYLVKWAFSRPAWIPELPYVAGIATGLIGLAAGLLVGVAMAVVARAAECGSQPTLRELAMTLGLVGVHLGWQAVVSVSLILSVTVFLASVVSRVVVRKINVAFWSATVLASTWLHIVLWRYLAGFRWWPGPSSPWVTHAASVVLSLVLAAAALILTRRRDESQAEERRADRDAVETASGM